MEKNLSEIDPTKPLHLDNCTCIYCGKHFDDQHSRTKEHVIARRFVPKGSLNNQWNLIVWACRACNNKKAALEDDISALSMQPTADGRFASSDEVFQSEAVRKGTGSLCRKTKRPVSQCGENFTLKAEVFAGTEFKINFRSPPKADTIRMRTLARCHIQSFFYLCSYRVEERQGGFPLGEFEHLLEVRREDWGNAVITGFDKQIQDWELRFNLIGANGYFKATIRRKSEGSEIWAWALEWNCNYRLIGYFGRREEIELSHQQLPSLTFHQISQTSSESIRFREEIPLDPDFDTLFSPTM